MDTIKPKSVFGHLLPGALFLLSLLYFEATLQADIQTLLKDKEATVDGAIFVALGIFAWFVGLFFDAIRNLFLEPLWDLIIKKDKKWWDFFFKGKTETINKMYEHYFSYYIVDFNVAIGSLILIVVDFCFFNHSISYKWTAIIVIISVIFILDARSLRNEMVRLVEEELGLENTPL